jgi:uncharacterized protein YjbI with pentapeptide repeats
MFSTAVIALLGVLLLIATVIPGIRLYWPKRHDEVTRSDLGIALMTGALIAFSVLALQLVIQVRSQRDANDREDQAERQALLLQLGRSTNLSGLDLHQKDLSEAYLNGKVLRGANLEQAIMERASFQDANLVAANLRGATLEDAHLDRADLRYADLAGAKLHGARLRGVNLDGATLSRLRHGEKFVRVDLSDADLANAQLRADLRYALLKEANLVGARLAPANLQGADLSSADLQFADLRGANLKGADLRQAKNLDAAKDLSFALFDGTTQWPKNFSWPPEIEGGKRPSCMKDTCTLPISVKPVNDFPPELKTMRKRLATAVRSPGCLTGWRMEEQPTQIEARAPRNRAKFDIATDPTDDTAEDWARTFQRAKRKVREIPSISANDAANTHAERFVRADNGEMVVAVYFVRRGRGFRVFGSARPALFPQFERDFLKLFRALNLSGNLFPSLRGGKGACRI